MTMPCNTVMSCVCIWYMYLCTRFLVSLCPRHRGHPAFRLHGYISHIAHPPQQVLPVLRYPNIDGKQKHGVVVDVFRPSIPSFFPTPIILVMLSITTSSRVLNAYCLLTGSTLGVRWTIDNSPGNAIPSMEGIDRISQPWNGGSYLFVLAIYISRRSLAPGRLSASGTPSSWCTPSSPGVQVPRKLVSLGLFTTHPRVPCPTFRTPRSGFRRLRRPATPSLPHSALIF